MNHNLSRLAVAIRHVARPERYQAVRKQACNAFPGLSQQIQPIFAYLVTTVLRGKGTSPHTLEQNTAI